MRRDDDMPDPDAKAKDDAGQLPSGDADRARRNRLVKVLIGVLLVVLLVVFVSTNLDRTEVQFVFFTASVPLIWVMLGCALLGGVVGFLIGKPGRQMGRKKPREQKPER